MLLAPKKVLPKKVLPKKVLPKKVLNDRLCMLDITNDIETLTTFRRRSGDFMKQLKKKTGNLHV